MHLIKKILKTKKFAKYLFVCRKIFFFFDKSKIKFMQTFLIPIYQVKKKEEL
jgi:hypothetical protein